MNDTIITLCIPIFDDWTSVALLLSEIDKCFALRTESVQVLLVDDCSTKKIEPLLGAEYKTISRVEVLHLHRNLGHQGAIAVGLSYIEKFWSCDAIVVMDGDGEDSAAGLEQLIDSFRSSSQDHIIFAERGRRFEKLGFRILYGIYRSIFRVMTGRVIRVGNFSLVPKEQLGCVAGITSLWNHYAASILKSKLPVAYVTIDRGRRYADTSTMNFYSLFVHGLNSISVYADVVVLRFLVASLSLIIVTAGVLALSWPIPFYSKVGLPGWETFFMAVLIVVSLQMTVLSILFVFVSLQNRSLAALLPARDYHFVVKGNSLVFESRRSAGGSPAKIIDLPRRKDSA